MKLLLVDDEPVLLESLADFLAYEGFSLVTARTVAEARDRVADCRLIILDWMLPDGQGIELLKEWRRRGVTTPVILLTARSEMDLFQDPGADELERKNALELLQKAYETRHGGTIPVDWKLPPEVTKLKVTVRRSQRPTEEAYAIKVSGNAVAMNRIRQLQLVRHPDVVVLDKAAKKGEWLEMNEPGEGPYFELDGENTPKPAPDGLYFINLELASGEVTKGWFILSDLVSSDTPVVRSPNVGQTFTTRTPTMRWDNFFSPEYKSYERRSLWGAVVKFEPPDYDWNEVWTMHEESPTSTEATVGLDPKGQGVKELANGRYLFYVAYKENRRFGPLRLGRQSVTVVPFHVRGIR